MDTHKDGNGNPFVDLNNLRITFISNKKRKNKKNWPDKHVLRFQSYKNTHDNSLHRGAEIPIDGYVTNIVKALLSLQRPIIEELGVRIKRHFTDEEYEKLIDAFRNNSQIHFSHTILHKVFNDQDMEISDGDAFLDMAENFANDIFKDQTVEPEDYEIMEIADGLYMRIEKIILELKSGDNIK